MAQNHKLSAGTFSGIFNHYQEEIDVNKIN
jgi:hypothetical protein